MILATISLPDSFEPWDGLVERYVRHRIVTGEKFSIHRENNYLPTTYTRISDPEGLLRSIHSTYSASIRRG